MTKFIPALCLCVALALPAGPATAQTATPSEVRMPSPPPPPAPKPSTVPATIEGVTCVACPEGERVFNGGNCINGVSCAASEVVPDDTNAAIRIALRHLEAARTALAGTKTATRTKALKEVEAALKELQAIGLRTAGSP